VRYNDFNRIADFIRQHAPHENFLLQDDTIKELVRQMYESADDEEKAVEYLKIYLHNCQVFNDQNESLREINELLRNNPYSYMAQRLLNSLTFRVQSFFLDVT
jgi:hypothetical protein